MAETAIINDPVSDIVSRILRDNGITAVASTTGGTNGSSTDWPTFTKNLPDSPDNLVRIIGTAGVNQGRFMEGMRVYRPGFQVLVRSYNYDYGWERANAIAVDLTENVANQSVTVGVNTYVVRAINITSGPIPLGKSVEDSKRYLFTVNGTMNLRKNP